jgi:hypothetical protein
MFQFVLFIAISLVLHLLVKLAARLVPREQHVDTADWPPEMITTVARRADRLGTLAALAAFLVILPAWIAAAYWLDFRLLPKPGPAEIIAVPLHWGRWVRGTVAAFVLAGVVALLVMRWVFGWRFDLMMAAGNRAFGYQASALFYCTLVWIVPFCVEYEIHSLGNCVYFAPDALAVHSAGYLPPQRHPYQDLTAIELARPYLEQRAEIGRSPECRISFQGGYRFTDVPWPFAWAGGGGPSDCEAICNIVSRHSGRPIKVVSKIEQMGR